MATTIHALNCNGPNFITTFTQLITYLICICNIGLRIAEGMLLEEKNQTTRAGGVQLRFAENSGWTSLGLSFS